MKHKPIRVTLFAILAACFAVGLYQSWSPSGRIRSWIAERFEENKKGDKQIRTLCFVCEKREGTIPVTYTRGHSVTLLRCKHCVPPKTMPAGRGQPTDRMSSGERRLLDYVILILGTFLAWSMFWAVAYRLLGVLDAKGKPLRGAKLLFGSTIAGSILIILFATLT